VPDALKQTLMRLSEDTLARCAAKRGFLFQICTSGSA
jgi:hypothetical protein